MTDLLSDLRYGLRGLLARPGFTIAVVLTLALGIGANTLVFNLIDALYLQPLPYRDDAALIDLENSYPKSGPVLAGVAIPDYLDRREHVPALADSALYTNASVNLAVSGAPQRMAAILATPSLFGTLGVGAALGRTFLDEEGIVGKDKVVVLGDRVWRNQFNADPGVVGRDLRLNGESYRVVGVMPATFMFPDRDTQFYMPFAFTPKATDDRARGYEFSSSVARLAPGATMADVKAQCDAIIRNNRERLGATGAEGARFSAFLESSGFTVESRSLRSALVGDSGRILVLLQGAVLLVLLIACANIANLLLTRLAARQKELSIRTALGAGRLRIVRQLLAETLLLALAGGAAGVALALIGARIVAASGLLPAWIDVGIDLRVLAFGLGVALAAGLLFGLFPALHVAGADPQRALRDARSLGGGTQARRVRDALVIVQFALAVTLLAGSALLLRSFANVLGDSPGFREDGLVTAGIALSPSKYPDAAARVGFVRRLLDEARTVPGASAVGIADTLPFTAGGGGATFQIDGRPEAGALPHGQVRAVDEDYFRTMGIALRSGRVFTRADWDDKAHVVVVDELFARRHFADQDALGQRIRIFVDNVSTPYTIVGVVANVTKDRLGETPQEGTYYFTFAESPSPVLQIALRTSAAPASLVPGLRAALARVDPEQPLFDVQTMQQRIDDSLVGRRVPLQLLGGFALLAALLATIGIYGVLAYVVAQRRNELGVRMAVGADAGRIGRLVVADGARLIAGGLGFGVIAAIGAGLLLRSQLYGVGSIDPASLAAVVALLALTGLAACWLPARRAMRVAPATALRNE